MVTAHAIALSGNRRTRWLLIALDCERKKIEKKKSTHDMSHEKYVELCGELKPFRAPEPLPILNPSNIVPKNGFPVVEGFSSRN